MPGMRFLRFSNRSVQKKVLYCASLQKDLFFAMDKTGRQPRIHKPNTIHHVMIRGNNRHDIFYHHDHFNHFLDIVAESAEKFDHKIIAYCLMNNHVHLLIQINQSPLSAVMQNINFRYARWFNSQLNRIGHLFQGRYRSIEVSDRFYLINLFRYIHLNPVKANLVSNFSQYIWSSHHHYTNLFAPSWMSKELMLFAIKNTANLNYEDFMQKDPERDQWKPRFDISDTGEITINSDVVHTFNEQEIFDRVPALKKSFSENFIVEIICRETNTQPS